MLDLAVNERGEGPRRRNQVLRHHLAFVAIRLKHEQPTSSIAGNVIANQENESPANRIAQEVNETVHMSAEPAMATMTGKA